jgi:hypothetical protein
LWLCENVRRFRPELVTKELAAASWQRMDSHFLLHQGIFDQKQHDSRPTPTLLTWLGPCDVSLFLQLKIQSFWHKGDDRGRIRGSSEYLIQHNYQDAFKK